jgi:hypothetical protein
LPQETREHAKGRVDASLLSVVASPAPTGRPKTARGIAPRNLSIRPHPFVPFAALRLRGFFLPFPSRTDRRGKAAKPRRRRRRLLHLHPRAAYATCECKSHPCQLLPERRGGALGCAKDAPGEWRAEWDPHSGRGGKIRESATPAGVGDTLGTRDPGSLRTPGYLLQRLRRNPQARSWTSGGGASGDHFRPGCDNRLRTSTATLGR